MIEIMFEYAGPRWLYISSTLTSVHPKEALHCHAAFATGAEAFAKKAFAVPEAPPPATARRSEWRR